MAIQPNKAAAELEQLRKRHTELDRAKAKAEANLKTALDSLELLKAEARRLFGTDDLPELRRKLEEMRKSNQQKLTEYQQHLQQIETSLAEVEKAHQQTRG
jgi:hypothetical protein